MFTGLIQATGRVVSLDPTPAGRRLVIEASGWPHRASEGDSIAVSGCCLTVASPPAGAGMLAFDVVTETLRMTTLGRLAGGAGVNLEHAATPMTLLGGHVVQGHVDGVGEIERVQTGQEVRISIRPPAELMEFVVPKGSITVDGVSLTIAAADPGAGTFEIALIPTTLAKTTLGSVRGGERCNLETDILTRTVVHWLRHYGRE